MKTEIKNLLKKLFIDEEMVKRKQLRIEQEQEQLKLEEQITNALKEIYVFPGTKKEFEDLMGYQTTFVNLGRRSLGLHYNPLPDNPFENENFEFQKKIVDSDVVALINSNFTHSYVSFSPNVEECFYGMPIKRK